MSERNKSIFNMTEEELKEKGVTIAQQYLIKRDCSVEDTFDFDNARFIYASDCNTPVIIKLTCNTKIDDESLPEFETDANAIQQAKNHLLLHIFYKKESLLLSKNFVSIIFLPPRKYSAAQPSRFVFAPAVWHGLPVPPNGVNI